MNPISRETVVSCKAMVSGTPLSAAEKYKSRLMANSLSTWSSDLYSFLERKLQSFSIREYGGVESRRSTLVSLLLSARTWTQSLQRDSMARRCGEIGELGPTVGKGS